jgi:hypothetical protein
VAIQKLVTNAAGGTGTADPSALGTQIHAYSWVGINAPPTRSIAAIAAMTESTLTMTNPPYSATPSDADAAAIPGRPYCPGHYSKLSWRPTSRRYNALFACIAHPFIGLTISIVTTMMGDLAGYGATLHCGQISLNSCQTDHHAALRGCAGRLRSPGGAARHRADGVPLALASDRPGMVVVAEPPRLARRPAAARMAALVGEEVGRASGTPSAAIRTPRPPPATRRRATPLRSLARRADSRGAGPDQQGAPGEAAARLRLRRQPTSNRPTGGSRKPAHHRLAAGGMRDPLRAHPPLPSSIASHLGAIHLGRTAGQPRSLRVGVPLRAGLGLALCASTLCGSGRGLWKAERS